MFQAHKAGGRVSVLQASIELMDQFGACSALRSYSEGPQVGQPDLGSVRDPEGFQGTGSNYPRLQSSGLQLGHGVWIFCDCHIVIPIKQG